MLHHYMGDVDGNVGAWGFACGGMGSISKALNASVAAASGEVRMRKGVEEFLVQNGRGKQRLASPSAIFSKAS